MDGNGTVLPSLRSQNLEDGVPGIHDDMILLVASKRGKKR